MEVTKLSHIGMPGCLICVRMVQVLSYCKQPRHTLAPSLIITVMLC